MTEQDDDLLELIGEFATESREHLAQVETDLLSLENGDAEPDAIHRVFRAAHSVKGAAGFLDLNKINDLAHVVENVLDLLRNEKLETSPDLISLLLESNDRLREMVEDVHNSETMEIADLLPRLTAFAEGNAPEAAPERDSTEQDPTEQYATETAEPGPEPASAPQDLAEAAAPEAEAPQANPSPPPPAPKAKAPVPRAETSKPSETTSSESIRVSVELLDKLMNLGGELVLSRNQLLQSHGSGNEKGVTIAATRLNQVVSEVQESIMQTRMQPVGGLFQRLPRIVRDLSTKLQKKVATKVAGNDVELDRSILEALSDPLTHLLRNALDHGLETPDVRQKAGKPPEGTVILDAAQTGGNVRITITDDGRGIDPYMIRRKAVEKGIIEEADADALSDHEAVNLIFAAGFSTAEQITEVSGRGVGMDVVRSNIEKLGGHIDIQSTLGKGTEIGITIPLTLAILPAMVLRTAAARYVIAQANVSELVRLRGSDRDERIANLDGHDVLRLRGEVIPLLRLGNVLGETDDASTCRDAATTIVVVETGKLRYALTVDAPPDAEEIVVKPLGRHLKHRAEFAGATILGDGCVAMILDAGGVADSAGLGGKDTARLQEDGAALDERDKTSVVLFRNSEHERFAVPLGLVDRIQRVDASELVGVGTRTVIKEDDRILPVIRLEEAISADPWEDSDRASVLVLRVHDQQIGVLAKLIEDIRTLDITVDGATLVEDGILGSFQLDESTVRLLDVSTLARKTNPSLFTSEPSSGSSKAADNRPKRVLFAEDTRFFRMHVQKLLVEAGFEVTAMADGELAWQEYSSGAGPFDLVLSDIQMPNCDGLELTRRIRGSGNTDIPIVALSSLSSEEDQQIAENAGVTAYLVKLDDVGLIEAVKQYTGAAMAGGRA